MPDWQRLWENREALPPTSNRRFVGPLLVALKKLFRPLGDFFLSSRLETQREFNLHLLRDMDALARRLEDLTRDTGESIQKIQSWYQERFTELQKEVLTLRDGTVPALLQAQELGLKGADLKAEWALARIIQLRRMLEKGVDLTSAEKAQAARGMAYAQFEDEFRGSPAEIREKQKRYLKELAGRGKVLDLGCGRGEFLELLKENNIPCLGVEQNPAMAAALKEKGLPFVQKEVLEFIREPGEAFFAVTAFHFIEHLAPDAAFALLNGLAARLQDGGLLVLETPNPASLASFLNFHKDPGHKTPWHPETLKFYLKQAGFKDIRIEFLHPFPPRPDVSLPKDLTDLLLGYQDYAAVAVKSS